MSRESAYSQMDTSQSDANLQQFLGSLGRQKDPEAFGEENEARAVNNERILGATGAVAGPEIHIGLHGLLDYGKKRIGQKVGEGAEKLVKAAGGSDELAAAVGRGNLTDAAEAGGRQVLGAARTRIEAGARGLAQRASAQLDEARAAVEDLSNQFKEAKAAARIATGDAKVAAQNEVARLQRKGQRAEAKARRMAKRAAQRSDDELSGVRNQLDEAAGKAQDTADTLASRGQAGAADAIDSASAATARAADGVDSAARLAGTRPGGLADEDLQFTDPATGEVTVPGGVPSAAASPHATATGPEADAAFDLDSPAVQSRSAALFAKQSKRRAFRIRQNKLARQAAEEKKFARAKGETEEDRDIRLQRAREGRMSDKARARAAAEREGRAAPRAAPEEISDAPPIPGKADAQPAPLDEESAPARASDPNADFEADSGPGPAPPPADQSLEDLSKTLKGNVASKAEGLTVTGDEPGAGLPTIKSLTRLGGQADADATASLKTLAQENAGVDASERAPIAGPTAPAATPVQPISAEGDLQNTTSDALRNSRPAPDDPIQAGADLRTSGETSGADARIVGPNDGAVSSDTYADGTPKPSAAQLTKTETADVGEDVGEEIATTEAAGGGPEDPLADLAALGIGLGTLLGGEFGTHKGPSASYYSPINPSEVRGV